MRCETACRPSGPDRPSGGRSSLHLSRRMLGRGTWCWASVAGAKAVADAADPQAAASRLFEQRVARQHPAGSHISASRTANPVGDRLIAVSARCTWWRGGSWRQFGHRPVRERARDQAAVAFGNEDSHESHGRASRIRWTAPSGQDPSLDRRGCDLRLRREPVFVVLTVGLGFWHRAMRRVPQPPG
jgi:hypothetical protein